MKTSIVGKLIGTSNELMAQKIGKIVTLQQITHGDHHARVTQEQNGHILIIVISYKEDIYEIEKQTQYSHA